MIVRVFRATVAAEHGQEFEEKFRAVSVPLVRRQRGFVSVVIGRPTRWRPDEYVMVSTWEDEAAVAAFVGPAWNEPHVPVGMEHLIRACSVDHYEVIDPG